MKNYLSLLLIVLLTITSLNGLGVSHGNGDGFLQSIMYEMFDSEPTKKAENEVATTGDEIETAATGDFGEDDNFPSRKSKIVSPTLFDSGPPPYSEYARMARYVVHLSSKSGGKEIYHLGSCQST
jgi:hypothetical protein